MSLELWIDGQRVGTERHCRVVLPLDLCPPSNRTRHTQRWQHAAEKEALWKAMASQVLPRRAALVGRPIVHCVRHSSVQPDRWSDWAKRPVDMLCCPRGRARTHRLGYLVDDSPKHAEVVQEWVYAPPGDGRVVIEVWT